MSYRVIQGSAHHIPELADRSVHVICTSPPYLGLRSYAGNQSVLWPTVEYSPMPGLPAIRIQGCEPGCTHEWGNSPIVEVGRNDGGRNIGGKGGNYQGDGPHKAQTTQGAYCIHCGGWKGGLGLEPSPEAYIGHLILCLREWHRILRDDGVAFVNLGDSYAGSGGYYPNSPSNQNGSLQAKTNARGDRNKQGRMADGGLKPKNLIGVPWRFAFAAQADGWILRSDIIWNKPNPMPESVTDRCTKSHEYIFMLAKQEDYYFDQEAIRTPHAEKSIERYEYGHNAPDDSTGLVSAASKTGAFQSKRMGDHINPSGANKRSVWTVATSPFSGAHFACWPEKLVDPMIRAGSSQYGACAKCGSPWERVVEREESDWAHRKANGATGGTLTNGHNTTFGNGTDHTLGQRKSVTTGWRPTCSCGCDDVTPCTVLDPFVGSGTTIRTALSLGRNAIGVDMSDAYLGDLVPKRAANVQMQLAL